LEEIVAVSFYFLAAFLPYFFLSGLIWGAAFEPSRKRDIDVAAKLLGLHKGMVVYDLGSGTGDVVIHLAKKYNVSCVGLEVDPLKAWISRLLVLKDQKLRNLIEIKRMNFLKADLSKADSVYVFLSGGTGIMRKLETKLSIELKSGAKVASCVHTFPDLKPILSSGKISVYSLADQKTAMP
jgi:SAM-dependent methyltransferase